LGARSSQHATESLIVRPTNISMQQMPSRPAAPLSPGRASAARAALTAGSAEILTRALSVVLSIVVARILDPHEVGILGLGVMAAGMISMLGYYVETACVITQGDATDGQYALAGLLMRSVVVALLIAATFGLLKISQRYLGFNHQDLTQLQAVLRVLVWMPVCELLSGYPQVVLQRQLDLTYVSAVQIVQPVIFVTISIVLLVSGHGIVGVALASVVGTAIVVLCLWMRLNRNHSIKLCLPSGRHIREIVTKCTRVFVGGFGGYLGERVDNFLVAGTLGPASMGFYSMAWNGSRIPANVIAKTTTSVLIPILARVREEPARVERAIRESLRHWYVMLVPTCAALYLSAPVAVPLVLGAKWVPLLPCLRIMCFTVLMAPVIFACGGLLVGTGRPQLGAIPTVIHILVLVVAIPVLARRWTIVGAAFADLIAVFFLTITLFLISRASVPQVNWNVLSIAARPVLCGISAGVIAIGTTASIRESLAKTILELLILGIAYPGLLLLSGGKDMLTQLTSMMRGVFRRRPAISKA